MKLIKLTKDYYQQCVEMNDEWKLDQEINHTNRSPWAIFKNDVRDFDTYLENLEISEPKDGKRKRRQKISSQEDSADHRAVDTSFDRADQPGGADGLYIFIIEDAG